MQCRARKARKARSVLRLLIVFLLIPALLYAQGLPIKSGATSDLATVDTNKNIRTSTGASTRATYIASASGLTTTAAYLLSIEASASLGFKLVNWCVGVPNGVAPTGVTITVQRRTTASSAGTACTAEGTAANCSVSKLDPADANFGGIARSIGTPGTAGAILDQVMVYPGEFGAGTADPPGLPVVCKSYGGATGEKSIVVQAGTANGLTINASLIAGGAATGSISATFIAE